MAAVLAPRRLNRHLSLDDPRARNSRTRSEVDTYWRAKRLVAELDGEEFHQEFEADRAKDADLVEAGLRVVRVTWDRLTRGAEREAVRFRRLLA